MNLNYDYLAGLIDGEGSFIVCISPRKRKGGTISIGLYMWIAIGQSYYDGAKLMQKITKWLNKEGIKTFLMKPAESWNGVKVQSLHISEFDSLRELCHRLNGHLILKQEALENFALILEMRKIRQRPIANIPWETSWGICPLCGANTIVKGGVRQIKRGEIQLYICKTCKHRFSTHNAYNRHFGTPTSIFNDEHEEFYRSVAVIWDNYRAKLHHRSWKNSLEERVLAILEQKYDTLISRQN